MKKALVLINADHVIGIVKSQSKGQKHFGLVQLIQKLKGFVSEKLGYHREVSYIYGSSAGVSPGTQKVCNDAGISVYLGNELKMFFSMSINAAGEQEDVFLLAPLSDFEALASEFSEKNVNLLYFSEEDPLSVNAQHSDRMLIGDIELVSYSPTA